MWTALFVLHTEILKYYQNWQSAFQSTTESHSVLVSAMQQAAEASMPPVGPNARQGGQCPARTCYFEDPLMGIVDKMDQRVAGKGLLRPVSEGEAQILVLDSATSRQTAAGCNCSFERSGENAQYSNCDKSPAVFAHRRY